MSGRNQRRGRQRGRFAMLPLAVLDKPAVLTLHHAHFRVLVLLAAQYTGSNNGALGLSKSQAATQGVTNKTLYRALSALEERGLISQTYPASRVPPRPTMYAITWKKLDDTDYSRKTRTPTHEYTKWAG